MICHKVVIYEIREMEAGDNEKKPKHISKYFFDFIFLTML